MILQAIADYVSKETGRDVTPGDINLSQDDLSADVTIGAPDNKTSEPKSKTKRAPKKEEPVAEVEETKVEADEDVLAETVTDDVKEEIQEEQAEEPAPAPKKTGSIFNFASEG